MIRKLALLLTALAFMPQLTLAQGGQFTPYAWDEADLAMLYPSEFDAPHASTEAETGRLSLQIEHEAANRALLLRVLPGSVADADLRAELDSVLAELDLLPLNYAAAALFGARADSASGVSADRAAVGEARIGRLPDQRVFAIVGRAPANQQEVLSDTLQTVIDSVVFSANSAPTVPAYTLMWRFPNPAEPSSAVTITRLVGLAYAPNNRVYALDAEQGVIVLNAETGAVIDSVPFDNPAQPRAVAADDAGTVYVADATCQCIRTLDAGGAWRDPIGTFSGGAPYGVAVAADGTVYATDKSPDGYEVHVYREGALTIAPLSFNSVAAPLLTVDSSGQGVVLEWLTSLIDSSVSGAVSVISGNSAGLRYWLEPFVPEDVFAIAGDNTGRLLLATAGGWLVTDGPLGDRRVASGPASLPIGGPFALTDPRGPAVAEADFRGGPVAIFFGFTPCPAVCPTTLGDMTALIEALGSDADRLHWLIISVDWERDTPEALAGYLEAFDPRIVGLSGSEVQVAAAARAFRVYYRRIPLEGGGYTMDHSASVFLLDAEGRFAGTIDSKESRDVALEKLRMLAGRDRSSG